MSAAWTALLAAVPSPSPSPTQGPDELQVTPGLAGFVATFAVAVACVLLFLSLTRHLRRAQRNAEDQGIPLEEPKHFGLDGPVRRPGDPDATSGGDTSRDDAGDGADDAGRSDGTDGEPGR
ncbi:hypothetical protein ACH436_08410 [Isoptericola sp. NPDC019693]|uniref:hypothetical protein n=1 Tax=Isoptericola sp. NPDC019693 TaxID=3364009 RepID=UPI0037A4D4A1